MAKWSLCLAVLALVAGSALAEDVLTLTGPTFADAVKEHEKLIVEFYAPWCGHCKKLTPEYEKAAGILKEHGIVLAKVDATEDQNKELASKYEIRGFPTLKIFRGDAEHPTEYQGPREADGIVSYSKKEFGPATEELKTADEITKAKEGEAVVVGVFPSGDGSAAFKEFKATAEALRNDATFVHVFDASLVDDAAGKDAVIVYKNYDEPMTKFDGDIEKAALTPFVTKTLMPRLVSLDRSEKNKKALSAMFADQKPKVLGFMKADDKEIDAFKEKLISVGDSSDDVHIIYVDPSENQGALEFFGVKTDDVPCVAVHAPADNSKFVSGKLDVKKVEGWISDYRAGKIEKTIKSEDIPASNDEPVKVLVAKQFEEIVFSGKDVMVEFYAPWCGHCKKLAPIYDELGDAFKDNDSVVIAKMDATANDVPSSKFNVQGFPTLYFVQGSTGEVKSYEGGRTLEDLKSFIEEHASATSAKDEL